MSKHRSLKGRPNGRPKSQPGQLKASKRKTLNRIRAEEVLSLESQILGIPKHEVIALKREEARPFKKPAPTFVPPPKQTGTGFWYHGLFGF